MNIACLLVGGPDRFIRDRTGKGWWFEDHPQMGPCPLTPKTHEPLTNLPPEDSPFWEAVQCWYDQGKRIAHDGILLWHKKPEPILKHRGNQTYRIIGHRTFDDAGRATVVMEDSA